jgi:hypothetical protein
LSFGFDPTRVFGDVRKDARKSRRKKKGDDMSDMMGDSFDGGFGLGIDTFSLASPDIDPLGIGEDFGERIGEPAGRANGKGSLLGMGGFLGEIGKIDRPIPTLLGTAKTQRKIGKRSTVIRPKTLKDQFEIFDEKGELVHTSTSLSKSRKKLETLRKGEGKFTFERVSGRTRKPSPLQARSGSRFGQVDQEAGRVLFGSIRSARSRIRKFREGRRTVRQDPPMLEFREEAVPAREARETPMLEDKSIQRGSLPKRTLVSGEGAPT